MCFISSQQTEAAEFTAVCDPLLDRSTRRWDATWELIWLHCRTSELLQKKINIHIPPSLSLSGRRRMMMKSLLQRTWPLLRRTWLRWTSPQRWGSKDWGTVVWTRAWHCWAEEQLNTSTCSGRNLRRGVDCLETRGEEHGEEAWPDRWDLWRLDRLWTDT